MKDSSVRVSGGRTLAYSDMGEPAWPCAFFFHGAPSSRLRLAYLEGAFVDAGVRVIAPDRPGYGRSTPQAARSLTNWPADVAALADSVGVERFAVVGHSSGGPYALVATATLPSRVSATFVLGGVTDMGWAGAWEGFPASEAELMRLPTEAAVEAACVSRFGENGSGFMAVSDLQFPEPDARLYADEDVATFLRAARAEAFRQGTGGYAQDVWIQGRPWTFAPEKIRSPVQVIHGRQDTLVPIAHSRHTAACIPGSTLRVLDDHGHFTPLGALPSILAEATHGLRPLPSSLRRRWRRKDVPGHEEAHVDRVATGWRLTGSLEAKEGAVTATLHYAIDCDAAWVTRSVLVEGSTGDRRVRVALTADGLGHWTGDAGPIAALDGTVDIDFGFSPLTNTLPIRRLALAVGQTAPVRTAWLRFPELCLGPLDQTYTREAGRVFRYRAAIDGGIFTARLDTDEYGLVTSYGHLWQADDV